MNRHRERDALDELVVAVRAGESRALVVRGDPGMGKTVLLDYLAGQAAGCRVVRASGVQSEMELAFAGLHQLCAPLLGHAEQLPTPQQDALRTAFGLVAGPPPDQFFVGLAVLSLLSEAAGERPLICLIDDQQWLDQASAQALGFTARRLGADPVALVLATRDPGPELAGLPGLEVDGLHENDARALLASALAGPLDPRVRDLIVAETRGNPLALLELPRGLSPADLAGGFGLPAAAPLTARIEHSFTRQLQALPEQTRRLVQLAAADPSGDRSLVWRAARQLGIPFDAGAPAVEAGLAEFGGHVRFRHPLARSAAYRSAALPDRQRMHAALAQATDPQADPDRRAWHRAHAAAGPDEDVAVELELSAGRAQARGGLAAAAAFLERAVALTTDPARRAERTLAAAQASLQAGAFGKALSLVTLAEIRPLDESQSARADWLRGQIAFVSGSGSDAPSLLLKAARRLEPLDLDLARQTYADAWHAAEFAGHLAGAGDLLEVSRAARALPPAHPPRPVDLLLDGLALWVTDGPTAAAPALWQATSAFVSADIPAEEVLRWGWLARVADRALWDDDGWRVTARQVQLAREAGALGRLPFLLTDMAIDAVWSGDLAASVSLIAEADAVCEATGSRLAPYATVMLASFRGNQAEAAPLIQSIIEEAAAAGGQGLAVTWAHRVTAILCNGLGRYQEALAAARHASEHKHVPVSMWAVPELIEAAVRTGNTRMASDTLDLLAETTRPGGTDYGLGIEARSRALLSEGKAAEGHYREAIDRLSRTRLRPQLARAHLLYGEWLRHEDRCLDAREQLRAAHDQFTSIGMEAFAERARRELIATGERVRKRTVETRDQLTPQEEQIARLARDGRTNPEIAAQLFLSPRTVEWHLRKVFGKLGVSSRRELHKALAHSGQDGLPA